MNKRNIIVYVSGKYSGDIDANIEIASIYAAMIWEAGYTCICPHNNTSHFENKCTCGYNDYIEGDLVLLGKCDVIFMLPGWEESKGAVIEYEEAKRRKIPIVHNIDELNKLYKETEG